jgi:hypothetical protein
MREAQEIEDEGHEQLAQLHAACERIVARVDASAWKQELT